MQVLSLNASYGQSQVLRDFSIALAGGEVLCLLGRNGAGKTSALKAIMGLLMPSSGRLLLNGDDLTGLPAHEIPRRGIGYVPQGRRLFGELSVRENLQIGLQARQSGPETLDLALRHFPVLRERMGQVSGTLSGGEQTMLAIARALCLRPSVLMLDEPTEGLMPSMIAAIREVVLKLRGEGVAILLVEQRVEAVLPVADRVAFMDHGTVQRIASVDEIKADPGLLQRYVGV